MNRPKAATRSAALAAFLLFAAGLLAVGPAEASRTTDARASLAAISATPLAPSSSLELVEPIDVPPRFGFAEDLGLLDPKRGPGGFVVFAAEAAQCELTYARNNPLKYVDPDGKASTPAGWVVELTKAGLRKMQPLFSKRALTAARRREMNVLVNGTRQSAGEIERAAFGGAESAYRHSGHVLEDGVSHGLPHFQTADRWGHTFYGALGVVGLVLSPFDSAEAASVDDTMIPTGAEDPRFTPYVWPDGSRKPAAPEEEEEKEGNPDGQPKNRKVPGDCGPTKPCETGR